MRPLTTQLYFPDETKLNARDDLFRDVLLVRRLGSSGDTTAYRFDFVLRNLATGP